MCVNFLNRNAEGWQPSGPSGGDRLFAACALRAAGVRVAVTPRLPPPRESILSGRVPAQDGPAFLPCHRGEIGPRRVCGALSHSPGVVPPALPANVPETCRITSRDIEPWSLRCGPRNPAQKTDGAAHSIGSGRGTLTDYSAVPWPGFASATGRDASRCSSLGTQAALDGRRVRAGSRPRISPDTQPRSKNRHHGAGKTGRKDLRGR